MSKKITESKPTTGPQSWKWRIAKAGHSGLSFADIAGFHHTKLSQYMSGKITPEPDRIAHVEKCLKKLGV